MPLLWFVVPFLATLVQTENMTDSRFVCSRSCTFLDYSSSFPYRARSSLECAAACARLVWCFKYDFSHNITGVHSSCLLYFEDTCPNSPASVASESVACLRVRTDFMSTWDRCQWSTLKVLQMNATSVSIPMGSRSLQNLCQTGIELRVKFSIGNSIYLGKANYITIKQAGDEICVIISDLMSGLNLTAAPLLIRNFCTNQSQSESIYNFQWFSGTAQSTQVSWFIGKKAQGSLITNSIIFPVGGDLSLLVPSIENGFSYRLILTNPSRICNVHVIVKSTTENTIWAQTILYENRKLNVMFLSSLGTYGQIAWDLLGSIQLDKSQQNGIWAGDPCWTQLYMSNSSNPTLTLINLQTAVELGQQIRVRFKYNDAILYATASYLALNPGSVAVHILNFAQTSTSFLSSALWPILNADLRWTHFIINSTGSILAWEVDAQSGTTSFKLVTSEVKFYAEVQTYTLIHKSSPSTPVNVTSLANLVAAVSAGYEIKLRIYTSDSYTVHYFTCDMLQIQDGGQSVLCLVSGFTCMEFLGMTAATTPSTTPNILGVSVALPVANMLPSGDSLTSSCQQSLEFTTTALVTSYLCFSNGSTVSVSNMTAAIEWLVPED